ncbi:MAG: DUF4905 domain-containing protein [Microscillaceae bacterium]|nr:DUF4905 domain-containing protein [Microscillaceae bacterium]MDW8461065.1 DUF4905 domain-containing protein [Cytophagales bacterium]
MLNLQTFTFKAPIFKIYFDEFLPHFYVVETRSHEAFEARFSVIYQNQLLIHDKLFPETWWLGISVVCKGIIFFYTYPQPEKPQPQGIIAFDAQQQKILWENYTLTYEDFTEQYLIAFHIENGKKKYHFLQIETGEVLKIGEQTNFLNKKNVILEKVMPLHYERDSFFFHFFIDFFKKRLNLHNVSKVDYAEWQNLIIMAYAVEQNTSQIYKLLIINQANEILWHDILANTQDRQELIIDTFQIINSYLLYIKNKRELVVLHLKSY